LVKNGLYATVLAYLLSSTLAIDTTDNVSALHVRPATCMCYSKFVSSVIT